MGKFLGETLNSMALQAKGHTSQSAIEFGEFFQKVRKVFIGSVSVRVLWKWNISVLDLMERKSAVVVEMLCLNKEEGPDSRIELIVHNNRGINVPRLWHLHCFLQDNSDEFVEMCIGTSNQLMSTVKPI